MALRKPRSVLRHRQPLRIAETDPSPKPVLIPQSPAQRVIKTVKNWWLEFRGQEAKDGCDIALVTEKVTPQWLEHTRDVIVTSCMLGGKTSRPRIAALVKSALTMERDPDQIARLQRLLSSLETMNSGVPSAAARLYFDIYVERYGKQMGFIRGID